jgi:hypothetical protein
MFALMHGDALPDHHQPELQRGAHPRRNLVREHHERREYFWRVKNVVPSVKVGKGLAEELAGVQV